jgi:NAD(P)-dependent dehydrogenase (short-subunit alcohol dehydrogenase family)
MPNRAAIVTGASRGIGLADRLHAGDDKELNGDGIKSVALCPGFVETPMTEFVREHVPAEEMIRVEDVAESVRFVLKTSPNCVVPEIAFQRPGEAL